MKNVMTRAWEIYRTLKGDKLAKLSQALKMAWAEVKNMAKKVVTPFTSDEEVTVDCFFYGSGMGFSHTCLEAKYSDGVLTLDNAEVTEWGERKPTKHRSDVKITIEHGFVSNGKDVRVINLDLANDCIKEITGKTYDIKNAIKEYGFKWNKETKSWVR